ncbi:MAG: glycosyltransferase family 1 protein [Pseudomonadota bacterium]
MLIWIYYHQAMRIAIATDAWKPQINGVVTTLERTRDQLEDLGHDVLLLTPDERISLPMPTYPEVRLSLFAGRRIRRELDGYQPDAVHVATEGPLGLAVRNYCVRRGLPFTTAYHTQFPEYVRKRFPMPMSVTSSVLRWFHAASTRTMVPTLSMRRTLEDRGFDNVVLWSRGVLTDVFTPDNPVRYDLPGPVWVYAGRVAVEKNIESFLSLNLPGSKVVIGDGPDRRRLALRYPDAHFLGYRVGEDLARCLAGGDVFVFPSRTDTFGLVMLEAMACGLPVAAFPVTGPIDVVRSGITGILDEDLSAACSRALDINRHDCRQFAERHSWRRATEQFLSHLAAPDIGEKQEVELTFGETVPNCPDQFDPGRASQIR